MADQDIDGYMWLLAAMDGYCWLSVAGLAVDKYMWLLGAVSAATCGYSWLLLYVCYWN